MTKNNDSLTRRQFINGAVATGGVAFTGLCAWGALSWNERKMARRRRAPEDGLTLAEYLTREAPKMDYFPIGILDYAVARFRAALTFERYLTFYRYKERVISSSKEEIDECVRQIDDFPPKTQALILAATVIFDSVWRSDPPESHYANAYRRWRRRVQTPSNAVKARKPVSFPADLEHYEISNFAKPGYRSRHNSSYWTRKPYVGLGAGAHSYDGARKRSSNCEDLTKYIQCIKEGKQVSEEEYLDDDTLYNELVMLALRTREGLYLPEVEFVYSRERSLYISQAAERAIKAGWLTKKADGHLCLTRQGLFVSDDVITDLMV